MTEQKVYDLVKRLLVRTKRGELAWERTTSNEEFLTSFPNYSVKVGLEWNQYHEVSNVVLEIYDAGGRAIETSIDGQLAAKLPPQESVVATMRELYNEARRKALGVDDALDKLLSELSE